MVFHPKWQRLELFKNDLLRSYQSFQLHPLRCYKKTIKQKKKSLNYSHLWYSSSLLSADWWSTHTPPFLSAGFDLIFAPHHRQHPEGVSWSILHCSGHDAERGEEKRREWWLLRLCRGSYHHGPTEHGYAGCAQHWDAWQWGRGGTASRNPTWSLLTKSLLACAYLSPGRPAPRPNFHQSSVPLSSSTLQEPIFPEKAPFWQRCLLTKDLCHPW